MRRLFRFGFLTFLGIGGLLATLLLATVRFFGTVDTNRAKPWLPQQGRQATPGSRARIGVHLAKDAAASLGPIRRAISLGPHGRSGQYRRQSCNSAVIQQQFSRNSALTSIENSSHLL